MKQDKITVSGMGIITKLGNNLSDYYNNLMSGKSGISNWTSLDTSRILCKIGGDLDGYDIKEHVSRIKNFIPSASFRKMKKILKTAPFTTSLTILSAVEAYIDASLHNRDIDPKRIACVMAGHNLNSSFIHRNTLQFLEEPEFIDGMTGVVVYDTDPLASVAEILGIQGHVFTVGGTCSSSLLALLAGMNKLRYEDFDYVLVIGAAMSYSPLDLHALTMIEAISYKSFNNKPEKASRPYDTRREGFVPAHGAGALILEKSNLAKSRNSNMYAQLLGVTTCSDANHLPNPSSEGQIFVMKEVLRKSGVDMKQIDYINAHATSTPLGDITEINSIKKSFNNHAENIVINATKSMLGHTGWSSGMVEIIASVLQMNNSRVHQSCNIDEISDGIDLDVCKDGPKNYNINFFIKNSFGFGGFNASALFSKT